MLISGRGFQEIRRGVRLLQRVPTENTAVLTLGYRYLVAHSLYTVQGCVFRSKDKAKVVMVFLSHSGVYIRG